MTESANLSERLRAWPKKSLNLGEGAEALITEAAALIEAQAREIEELRNPKPSGGPEWAAEMKREKKRLRALSRTGDGNG